MRKKKFGFTSFYYYIQTQYITRGLAYSQIEVQKIVFWYL